MHVSRFGVVMAVALGALAGGCASDASESDAPPDEGPVETGDVDDERAPPGSDEFAVTFTGQQITMNARAELQVNEGERDVHLTVTGRTPGTDVIVIDLTFDGLENVFGTHTVQFSLPDGGPHDANGSLGGEWYYSQSGQATLDLSADGRTDGQFEIGLARADEDGQQAEPFEFKPTTESAPLLITFSVPWVLSCHSHLAGHGILQPGGDFCDELDLDGEQSEPVPSEPAYP